MALSLYCWSFKVLSHYKQYSPTHTHTHTARLSLYSVTGYTMLFFLYHKQSHTNGWIRGNTGFSVLPKDSLTRGPWKLGIKLPPIQLADDCAYDCSSSWATAAPAGVAVLNNKLVAASNDLHATFVKFYLNYSKTFVMQIDEQSESSKQCRERNAFWHTWCQQSGIKAGEPLGSADITNTKTHAQSSRCNLYRHTVLNAHKEMNPQGVYSLAPCVVPFMKVLNALTYKERMVEKIL